MFDILSAMRAANLRVRESPKYSVNGHEYGLGEDPSKVNGPSLNLPPLHVDVVFTSVVALGSSFDGRSRDLWRRTEKKNDHSIISSNKPKTYKC